MSSFARQTIPIHSIKETYSYPQTLLKYDFTDRTSFGGIRLSPRPAIGTQAATRINLRPVHVVESKDAIIDGHNGIFQDGLRQFLTKYVSFIEAKRLLLRAERKLQIRTSDAASTCQ